MGFVTNDFERNKYSISFDARYLTMPIAEIKEAEAKRLADENNRFEREQRLAALEAERNRKLKREELEKIFKEFQDMFERTEYERLKKKLG